VDATYAKPLAVPQAALLLPVVSAIAVGCVIVVVPVVLQPFASLTETV